MLCLQIDLFGRYVDRLVISDNRAALILTPICKHTLRDLLASWAPLEDALPEVEDLPAQPLR